MFRNLSLALRVSTGILVFCGYGALASVDLYTPLLLVIPVVALALAPLGERFDRRYRGYRVISNAVTIGFGCFLPLLYLQLGLLNAVVSLVVYIQVYVLLHHKEERNYYHLFLMAFFLLLAASVQAPEPVVGVVMAVFLVSAVWCFSTLRLYNDARGGTLAQTDAAAAFENRVAATDFVPLRPGTTRRDLSRLRGGHFDGPLIAGFVVLSVVAVLLTGLFFVVTPRTEAGILGRSNIVIQQTGLTDTVDLTDGAYVQEDMTAVMRVTFPGGLPPETGAFYWRVMTLPNYYQGRWSRQELDNHYEPGIRPIRPYDLRNFRSPNPHLVNREERPDKRIVHQSIFIDNVPKEGLPVLDLVQKVFLPTEPKKTQINWGSNLDFSIFAALSGPRQLEYEAWSEVGEPNPGDLEKAGTDYTGVSESDLVTLTTHDLLGRTVELTREVIGDADTIYEQARAIEAWLSGPNFLYTLNVPALPAEHAIDDFLARVRMGHCEIYASAMALMMRSLGVPARVVVGYRGGEWNETEQAYIVRANMAHLWVEVLFPQYGWVKFDPSPRSIDEDFGTVDSIRRSLSVMVLRGKMFWYQEVVGFDRGVQLDRLREFSLRLFGRNDSEEQAKEEGKPEVGHVRPWAWQVWLGAILAGLALLVWRMRPRAKEYLLTADQARASRLYQDLRDKLRRDGVDIAGMTADEILRLDVFGEKLEPATVKEILRQYNEARFGMRPMPQSRVAELRRALRRALPARAEIGGK